MNLLPRIHTPLPRGVWSPAGIAILMTSSPVSLPKALACAGMLFAAALAAPAGAQVQCDCGSYLMSCRAGCLGNPYCNTRCQQFHDTCTASCSGTHAGGSGRHSRDDDDDDGYPHRHRRW